MTVVTVPGQRGPWGPGQSLPAGPNENIRVHTGKEVAAVRRWVLGPPEGYCVLFTSHMGQQPLHTYWVCLLARPPSQP